MPYITIKIMLTCTEQDINNEKNQFSFLKGWTSTPRLSYLFAFSVEDHVWIIRNKGKYEQK